MWVPCSLLFSQKKKEFFFLYMCIQFWFTLTFFDLHLVRPIKVGIVLYWPTCAWNWGTGLEKWFARLHRRARNTIGLPLVPYSKIHFLSVRKGLFQMAGSALITNITQGITQSSTCPLPIPAGKPQCHTCLLVYKETAAARCCFLLMGCWEKMLCFW